MISIYQSHLNDFNGFGAILSYEYVNYLPEIYVLAPAAYLPMLDAGRWPPGNLATE